MPIIAQARPAVALANLDLCTPARLAGWRHAEVVRPDELLCGAAMLLLAGQSIAVRLVVNTGEDASPLLEQLRHDVLHAFFLEQYIVMADFTPEAIQAYQATFAGVTTRRVTVGSPQDYRAWLPARLGPLGPLPVDSPLRRLTEHMLCVTSAPEPKVKCDREGKHKGSKIEESFVLGALGVQAVETLFRFTRGKGNVENVVSNAAYQRKDIDLRVSGLGGAMVDTEVKNEQYKKNLSFEHKSNAEADTEGWFHYSAAAILCTCFWPTGELFLMELEKVREWVFADVNAFSLVPGRAKGQTYTSRCWLAPANRLLSEVQASVRISLNDWLPTLYAGQFKATTEVSAHLQKQKTLLPQRLDWPV